MSRKNNKIQVYNHQPEGKLQTPKRILKTKRWNNTQEGREATSLRLLSRITLDLGSMGNPMKELDPCFSSLSFGTCKHNQKQDEKYDTLINLNQNSVQAYEPRWSIPYSLEVTSMVFSLRRAKMHIPQMTNTMHNHREPILMEGYYNF